jgi:hypothetical protein
VILARALILPVSVLSLAAAVALPAHADPTPTGSPTGSPSPTVTATATPTASPTGSSSSSPTSSPIPTPAPRYYSATLTGANELPPAGDPNGRAKALVRIDGSQVTFAFSWKGVATPTMAHVHQAAAGVDGPVVVPLFTSALPATSTAAAGSVMVDDASLVQAITADPAGFYLNLHTGEYPAGAVRGQLTPLRRPAEPLSLISGLPLQSIMDGAHETPAAGDPDGRGVGLVRASGRRVDYALAWDGIGTPTMAHLHVGAAGAAGPVVVPFFMGALPDSLFAVAGQVDGLSKALVTDVRTHPGSYYTNVHTTEFPAGAVRGQLFVAGHLSLP